VLSPEVAVLARAVADRTAGTLPDVLRLALPPRHARVEAEPPREPAPPRRRPSRGAWARYAAGPRLLEALAAGGSPRAVWTALPGRAGRPRWPLPSRPACPAAAAPSWWCPTRATSTAWPPRWPRPASRPWRCRRGSGPAERYRRWLAVRAGRSAPSSGPAPPPSRPVHDLGLVVVWDDGDDLHVEPRSPYAHVREVLALRAHLTGAAAIVGGHVRTAEGQLLVESGWARAVAATREQVRAVAPAVDGVADDQLARDPLARAARLPAAAFDAARTSLAAGAPVLVQVPRRGWTPSLACAVDRTPARCPQCAGPLAEASRDGVLSCRWCGRLASDWRCPTCEGRRVRAVVVGARRTAEELGRAFPGVRCAPRPRRRPGRGAGAPALVVATPGAEPVADGGYGAVLLLDTWALLGRADLRRGRRRCGGGRPRRHWPDPARGRAASSSWATARCGRCRRWCGGTRRGRRARAADRAALGFPLPCASPRSRLRARSWRRSRPPSATPRSRPRRPGAGARGDDVERLLLRVPRARSAELATLLKGVVATRSARKAEPVRVELDPRELA
jgi:primosomal protein N' (replication factor Y)